MEEGRRSTGARPRHSLPYPKKPNRNLYTEKELLDRIYQELFDTIGHAPDRLHLGDTSNQGVDRWLALTTLHPNQIGPVAGSRSIRRYCDAPQHLAGIQPLHFIPLVVMRSKDILGHSTMGFGKTHGPGKV